MKLGITCEGGAYRTIFSCGVLDAFLEENIMADYFIGVSAGIAYGISYLSQQHERNLRIFEKYAAEPRYLSFRNLFNPRNRSVYGLKFAFETVPAELEIFDHDAFAAFPGEVLAVATDLDTGKPTYIPKPRRDPSFTVLKASCAMPMLFPVIRYEGHKYLDGGVSDPIPFQKAITDGCNKNIVILTRERSYYKETDSSLKLAAFIYRKYPHFVQTLQDRCQKYNQTRQLLFEMEQRGEIFVFAPESTEGFSRLEKDQTKLHQMYDQGHRQVKTRLAKLKDYLNK